MWSRSRSTTSLPIATNPFGPSEEMRGLSTPCSSLLDRVQCPGEAAGHIVRLPGPVQVRLRELLSGISVCVSRDGSDTSIGIAVRWPSICQLCKSPLRKVARSLWSPESRSEPTEKSVTSCEHGIVWTTDNLRPCRRYKRS